MIQIRSIKIDPGYGSILHCTFVYAYNEWGPIGVDFPYFLVGNPFIT